MKFSQRYGYTPVEVAFQRESVDEELRTKLWNVMWIFIWGPYEKSQPWTITDAVDGMIHRLWFQFFNHGLDNLPPYATRHGTKGWYDTLKNHFFTCRWFEVYDLLQAIANDESNLVSNNVRGHFNRALEVHNAAYRFVGKEIIEVTDEQEIKGIEGGIEDAEVPVRIHLKAALRMLSDRQTPDYRNSIKESISAVEAACRLVCGDTSATLGAALKKVENLHPALSKAFNQLYGYTSDASGVRHAIIDDPTITYADAKFMLVACSAFVSYLKLTTTDQ